jgi:enediyne biosynthesis protein E4
VSAGVGTVRGTPFVWLVLAGCGTDKGGEPPPNLGLPVTLDQSGAQACPSPITRSADGPFEKLHSQLPAPSDPWIWHGGITAADLDGNGLLDVLVALEQGVQLFESAPTGEFVQWGQELFGEFELTYGSGVTTADYDGDGDLDLYVMRVAGYPAAEWTEESEIGKNRLLRNDGGSFTDVTDSAGGVDGCGVHQRTGAYGCWKTMTSSWGDIDADGDLDLYVGNYGFVDETEGTKQEDMEPAEPDFLYLNNGDGTFTDASDRLPDKVKEGYTYAGGLFDLDDDGDLDLYTVNDFGNLWPNRALWNDGTGQFVFKDPDPSGLQVQTTGMGLGIGDLNGDDLPDLFMPIWNHHLLLESRASGVWIDVSQLRGIYEPTFRIQDVAWGTELGDVDNDGDLDAVSQYGFVKNDNSVWKNEVEQPDSLYLNEPTGLDDGGYTFVDEAVTWGVADLGMSRGAVLADLNRDGWLDIGKRILNYEGNSSFSDSAMYLSRCGEEGWLEVHLRQPGTMNRFAIGAKVTVEAGGKRLVRTLYGGGTGYASQPPPELHFGLGDVDVIDELTVRWPDGQESVVLDLDARQQVTITR